MGRLGRFGLLLAVSFVGYAYFVYLCFGLSLGFVCCFDFLLEASGLCRSPRVVDCAGRLVKGLGCVAFVNCRLCALWRVDII